MDQAQLDSIEAKLDRILAVLDKLQPLIDKALRWRKATPWAGPTTTRRVDDGHQGST